jgi:hypothetical protein
MNLKPNLSKIFKENLDAVSNNIVSMGAPQKPKKEYAVVRYENDNEETTIPIVRWEGDVAVCLDANGSEIGVKPIRVVNKPFFEKHGGEAFGKTLQDIADHHKVDIEKLEKQLEKGIAIEGEHGKDKESARRIAMDHLWENPEYYSKLVASGLEEPIEEGLLGSLGNAAMGAVKGAVQGFSGKNQDQGQDPSQMDPEKYKKYKAESEKIRKDIDKMTQQLQKLRADKASLAKKYGVNPNA